MLAYCVQDGGPPRGALGGAPTFRGRGWSGLPFLASVCLGAARGPASPRIGRSGRSWLFADRDLLYIPMYILFKEQGIAHFSF